MSHLIPNKNDVFLHIIKELILKGVNTPKTLVNSLYTKVWNLLT